MQLKLLCVFVFLCVHVSQISAYPTDNKSIIEDIIQKAKELYEKVNAFIEEKIQDAIEILEEIRNNLMEDALNIIKAVRTELERIISNAKETIEQIKQNAEDLGIDITSCLEDNEDRFNTLFRELIQNEAQCVQIEIDSSMEIINEAVVIFSEAIHAIHNVPARLKECQNIECVKDVITEIVEMEKELPAQITKTVQQIEEFIETFEERIEICSAKVVTEAVLRVAEIVHDVTKCAAGRQYGIACPEEVID